MVLENRNQAESFVFSSSATASPTLMTCRLLSPRPLKPTGIKSLSIRLWRFLTSVLRIIGSRETLARRSRKDDGILSYFSRGPQRCLGVAHLCSSTPHDSPQTFAAPERSRR